MFKEKVLWLAVVLLLVAFWGLYVYHGEDRNAVPGEMGEKAVMDKGELDDVVKTGEQINDEEITLKYLGHAAFLLQAGETIFLMDPYDPNCGYGKLEVQADYVTVSHEHMDHNYIAAAPGAKPIRGLSPDGLGWEEVSLTLDGVDVFTVPSYHDNAAGKLRGRNAIFVFDTGLVRLVHLGDLGHPLNQEHLDKLAPVDVLLIPVGGHFTIDGTDAVEIIHKLEPAIVVPMHYRTDPTRNWPIAPLEDFLKLMNGMEKRKSSEIKLGRDSLPQETEIWIMDAETAAR